MTAGRRRKVITPEAAAELIVDGTRWRSGGFGGISVPEELLIALAKRFGETRGPRDLTLVFAAGQGWRRPRAQSPYARRAGPARDRCALGSRSCAARAASDGRIEAYCLPQGVLTHLYRGTAACRPGLLTRVGLGTFVDPRIDGCRLNAVSTEEVVHVIELDDDELLFYRAAHSTWRSCAAQPPTRTAT